MYRIDTIKIESYFLKKIREFFDLRGYLEVQTPILVNVPGAEVHLDYFSTEWKDLDGYKKTMYLRSSPELHLKTLINEGLDKIYEIAPSFRNNGERLRWHSPEFKMLEWYERDLGFESMIDMTEELIWFLWEKMKEEYPDRVVLEKKKFKRISMSEAFSRWVGIELIDKDLDLWKKARKAGVVSVNENEDFETSFFKILIEKIEPKLKEEGLCVLYDYPPSQAALSRVEGGVSKRQEFYINGIEISNAFLELSGYDENKARILEINGLRKKLSKQLFDESLQDEYFSSFLKPTSFKLCSGNALGIQRLISCIIGQESLMVCFDKEFDRVDGKRF